MADYYQMILDSRAKKIINRAEQSGLDYKDVMREAARAGVADNQNVLNYAKTLKAQADIGRQQEITGAVGRVLTPQPKGLDEALSLAPQEFAKKLEQTPQAYQGTTMPESREQFYGGMGEQQLSPETSIEDVKSNPAFQFALGRFPGLEDELAKERLRIAAGESERKAKQDAESNRLRGLENRRRANNTALEYYKLGLKYQEGDLDAADKLDTMAEETKKDQGFVEGQINKWKQIKKGATEFGEFTPEEVDAQLANLEKQYNTLNDQVKALEQRASGIRSQAYGKGKKISTGSAKVFETPTPQQTPPAALPRQRTGEDIAKDYGL